MEVDGAAVPRYDDHMLHALVHRARGKLRRAGLNLNSYLTSVPGVGYRLDATPREGSGVPGGDDGVLRASRRRLALGIAGLALFLAAGGVAVGIGLGGGGDDDAGALVGASSATEAIGLCGSELISPVPGTVLAGDTVTFEWTAGCGMTKYDLWVGCTPGAVDFLNPDDGALLEATATGLPLDGGPVYVQLSSSNGTEDGGFVRRLEYVAATEPGAGTSLLVHGDAGWTDTGLDVGPGTGPDLESCGQVYINTAGFPTGQPDGDPECLGVWKAGLPAPDLPCWSLIGRIGDGAPFLVGESWRPSADTPSGRLFLRVNDDNLEDNSGHFRATVRRDE